jgi:hypothetical protein
MAHRKGAAAGSPRVRARTYRKRVEEHLRRYRPTEYKEAKRRVTTDQVEVV